MKVSDRLFSEIYLTVPCLSCLLKTELVSSFMLCLAGFKRPVVLFGPISDAVNEKLATDMPNDFVIASKCLHPQPITEVVLKMHLGRGSVSAFPFHTVVDFVHIDPHDNAVSKIYI